jgi:hypothetical protein
MLSSDDMPHAFTGSPAAQAASVYELKPLAHPGLNLL